MLFFSRTKTIATLAVLALCFLLALPNALPASVRAMLPLFNGPVVLGLDLQGGSHVLLEVDQATLKDQYAKQLIGDIRQALRAQKIPYSGLGKSGGQRHGPHHRSLPPRCGDERIAQAGAADRHQPVRQRQLDQAVRYPPGRRSDHLLLHRRRARIQDRPRHRAVARHRRQAHQCHRHDRADHPAPGRGPHSRPGSGPAGPEPPQGSPRPDRQAAVPAAVRQPADQRQPNGRRPIAKPCRTRSRPTRSTGSRPRAAPPSMART